MSPTSHVLDPERLLAQAGWVRSVVRRLVRDEALAEEIVQDTWVAALEKRSKPEERGGLRAWLGAVARNLALRRRRREAVRSAIERQAARAERIECGTPEVERMQLQRVLVDAVLALDEPYRSAVILRHLDGLSAGEIARRQGCTSAAARQRVSRGLAELRRRLEQRFGEGGHGCLALVPLLGRGWNPATLVGGLTVGSKLTVGIAGAALAALALWFTLGEDGERRAPRASAAAAPEEARSVASAPAELASDRPHPASIPGVEEEPRRIEAEREAGLPPLDPAGLFRLDLRVTDTRGNPLSEAVLTLHDGGEPLERTSNAEGRFEERVPRALLERPQALHVRRDGYLARRLEHDLALPLTVQLQAPPALFGRVLDPEHRPAKPSGYVKATVLDALTRESRTREAELREDGSYRIPGLAPGRLVHLEARARGFAAVELAPDRALAPDEELEQDLVLSPGAVVTGVVLDAETRAPLAGAEVWMDGFQPEPDSVHPFATTDAAGRFRLAGANEEIHVEGENRFARFWLVARAAGYAASPLVHFASSVNDAHVYDFEMTLEPAAASLRVRVLIADDRPAAGATVWAIDAQGNPFFETADEEGEHRFEGLPAGPFGLWLAWEERHTIESLGNGVYRGFVPSAGLPPGVLLTTERRARRVDLELARGEARSEVFVLDAPGKAGLAGRVVDAEGHGVPNFAVRAQLNFDLHNLRLASGYDETRTNAEGIYRFAGLYPGLYQVWASGEGSTMPCAQPHDTYVRVEPERESAVEDFAVGACLSIEGRVESSGPELDSLELALLDPASGTRLGETKPAADGSFRFDPVLARRYELVLLRGEQELDRTPVSLSSASGLFLRAR